jgi:hypothetical protein
VIRPSNTKCKIDILIELLRIDFCFQGLLELLGASGSLLERPGCLPVLPYLRCDASQMLPRSLPDVSFQKNICLGSGAGGMGFLGAFPDLRSCEKGYNFSIILENG